MGADLLDVQQRKILAEFSMPRIDRRRGAEFTAIDSSENLSLHSFAERLAPEAMNSRKDRMFGESKTAPSPNVENRSMVSSSLFVLHAHDCPSIKLVATFLKGAGFEIEDMNPEHGIIEATGDAGITKALAHTDLFGYVRTTMMYWARKNVD